MHSHPNVLSSKVIKMIFRLITGCLALLFLKSSIVYGETNTIEVIQLIEKSLPPNLKLRNKGSRSISRKQSRFGKVNHVFIYIHKRDSKEPIINERSDGCIILLPITYVYQSEYIKNKYENTFVADTLNHKLFLLTDEKDIPTWNKFRENLKVNVAMLSKTSQCGTNAVGSKKLSLGESGK